MAIRACCLSDSDNAKLSREITKAVIERANAEVAYERRIQSVEASSKNDSHDLPRKKRSRSGSTASTAATSANTISPMPLPSSTSAQKPPPAQATFSDHHISHGHDQFTAPYLQNGRQKGSHFRKKVESMKVNLRNEGAPITPIAKNNTVKRTRKSSLQKNTSWVNEKSAKDDRDKRFTDASKQAIAAFSANKQNKDTEWSKMSQQSICNELNRRFSLDGEGKEGSREQGKLTVRTVSRWVDNGIIEPPKKGRAQKIDRCLLRLVALHANMCQVGMTGEVDPKHLKGILLAAVLGTDYEKGFHLEYAWEVCRRENCDILQPAGRIQAEDIRWQWVTHQNLVEYFEMLKVSCS